MRLKIVPTEDFVKSLKQIYKKHKAIKSDIAKLSADLKENPKLGVDLGQNVFKIRLAITGTNKGKSGGARVITYVYLDNDLIYLSHLYLKSDSDSVDPNIIIERLKDQGLI